MARSEGPGYACKLNNDNYTQEIQITGLKKEMFEGNRFSLDMWLYPEGDKTSYGLLMQANPPGSANANNFVFAVQDQLPYLLLFRENGVKRIDCAHPLLKIENNQWNHLFITYDGFVLKFYIQGILAGSEEVLNESVFSSLIEEKPCVVGGYANSLIHSLRLYSREIAEEDFEKYIYEDAYNSPQMPYMVCFLRGNFQSQGIDNLCGGSVEAGFYGSISVVQVSGMWPAFGVLPDIFLNKAYSVYETGNPEHPGRLEIKGIPSGVLDPHHFSFDIWFYPTEDRAYSLLSQSSNFQIGVQSDGVLYFHHPSIGKFSVSEKFKIQKNIWNHVFFVYDAARADFYLQGYLVYSEKVGSTAFVNDTPYLAGDGFCGFIRSLRVYGKALKREEVSRYIYEKSYDEEKMPDAALFLVSERHGEKGKLEIRNLSNISVEIEKSSSCALGYVTPVYESRKEDGIAAWAGDTALERELFSPGQPFSMFVKFYVLPSDNNNQSLISTFLSLTQFGMGIKREAGSKAFLPYVRLETSPVCVGEKEIKEEEWNDLLISYDGSKLTMFVNGEDCGSFEIDSFPANEFSEENPGGMLVLCTSMWEEGGLYNPARFVGYLRNAALFTKALKREDAEAFHINEPFLYEDGLKALYNFDNKVPLDLVRREPFSLFASGSSKLVSVYGNPVWGEEERIRITKPVPSYSDELLRQASLLLIPILKYCGYFYGLEVKEEFRQLFLNYSAKDFIGSFSDVAVVEKVSVSDQTTQEDILDLLKSVNIEKFSGMFLSLCLDSRQNGTAQVADSVFAIANSWAGNLDFSQQMSSFSALPLIQTVLSESLSEIERVKKENPPSFKKAYYACEIDNTDPLQESYLEISETRWESLDPHHFSFDIWFYPKEEKEYSLLSQGSGFQLKVRQDGSLYFSYPAVGAFSSSSDFRVQKNSWNHVFFIYDSTAVAFYLQGYLVYFEDVGSTSLIGAGSLLIGKGFSGYIRSVRVYGGAVLEEDFPKYLYQNDYAEESMRDVKLFLQCRMSEGGERLEVKDAGPSSFPVALRGKCGAKMVTPAYVFDGHACLEDPDESTNPGNFESGEFSIYAKVRLERNEAGNQPVMSLFSNIYDFSTVSKGVDVYFFSLVSNCSFRIGAGIGGGGATGNIDILPERWTDIMVVYAQNSLTFYVNGEFDSHFKGPYIVDSGLRGGVRLGEKSATFSSAANFQGSVAKIAVFDKALSEEDAAAFHENEPFIYEDGLRALYSFDDGFGAVELLKGRQLNGALADFSQLVCVPISSLSSMYEYRTTREVPEYTQEELYIASLLLNIFLMYYRGFYGLEPEDEKRETFLRYFASTFLDFFSDSALCEKIAGDKRVSPEDIVGLLKLFDVEKFSGMFSSLWLDTLQNRGEAIRDSISAVSGSLARNQAFSGGLDSFLETERVSSLIEEVTKAINKEKPNDNKKAYYACRVDHKGTNKSIRIEGMDPSLLRDGKEFSFDLWFYPDPGSEEYCLLSQEGGFSCGVTKKGALYFTHPSIERAETSEEDLKVENGVWNHLFLIYGNGGLLLYLRGYSVYLRAEKELKPLVTSSAFEFGKNFSGFINMLRFHRAFVSPVEVNNYIGCPQFDEGEMPSVLAYIDFVMWEVRMGKDAASTITLPAVRPAECEFTDALSAYVPRENHCYPVEQPEVNPGGFTSGSFSLYVKLYKKPVSAGDAEKQTLFANGNFEDSERVIVYLQRKAEGGFVPCVDLGDITLEGERLVWDSCWTDIAVVYIGEEKRLSLFMNGKPIGAVLTESAFHRGSQGAVTLGNAQLGSQPFAFSGYITTAAVFESVLSEEDIGDFYENEPFIYEDGLAALYSFDSGSALELLSEKTLEKYSEDVRMVTGTNRSEEQEEYVYRIHKTKPVFSEKLLEKAAIVLDLYSQYCEDVYGMEADEAALKNYKEYFADRILQGDVFNKFSTVEDLTEEIGKDILLTFNQARTIKLYMEKCPEKTNSKMGLSITPVNVRLIRWWRFPFWERGSMIISHILTTTNNTTLISIIHISMNASILCAGLTYALAKLGKILCLGVAIGWGTKTIVSLVKEFIEWLKDKDDPEIEGSHESRIRFMVNLSSVGYQGGRSFYQEKEKGDQPASLEEDSCQWKSGDEFVTPVLYTVSDLKTKAVCQSQAEVTTELVIRIPFKKKRGQNAWGVLRSAAPLKKADEFDGEKCCLKFEERAEDSVQEVVVVEPPELFEKDKIEVNKLPSSCGKEFLSSLKLTDGGWKKLKKSLEDKIKKMDKDFKKTLDGLEIRLKIKGAEEEEKKWKCNVTLRRPLESLDKNTPPVFEGVTKDVEVNKPFLVTLSSPILQSTDYPYIYRDATELWDYEVSVRFSENDSSSGPCRSKLIDPGIPLYILPFDFPGESNPLISFTDENRYPIIEFIGAFASTKPVDKVDAYKTLVSSLYQCNWFKYKEDPFYEGDSYLTDTSAFEGEVYIRSLDIKKFLSFCNDTKNTSRFPIEAESGMYAVILAYGFALLGKTGDVWLSSINGAGSQGRLIETKSLVAAGHSHAGVYSGDYHFAIEYEGKIYDASFNKAGVVFMDSSNRYTFSNFDDKDSYRKDIFLNAEKTDKDPRKETKVFITQQFSLRDINAFSFLVGEEFEGRPNPAPVVNPAKSK